MQNIQNQNLTLADVENVVKRVYDTKSTKLNMLYRHLLAHVKNS